MGIKYSQLTQVQRVKIELLLGQGDRAVDIAQAVGVSRSTVYREISRGKLLAVSSYSAAHGQFVHDKRRKGAGLARRKLGSDPSSAAWRPYRVALGAGWSPQQIVGRLRLMDSLLMPVPGLTRVSHETLYKAIYNLPRSKQRGSLTRLLRLSRYGRRRRRDQKSRFTGIQNMTPIQQRPAEVQWRVKIGHWEGDLVEGAKGQSCIATLVERHSRYTLLVPLRDGTSSEVCRAVIEALGKLPPEQRLSLTYDRGTEMALHQLVTQELNMPVFFCDAYSPWQRGTNENTNGLIRQYLPKGTDLSQISARELAVIQDALNDRPRQVLAFRTPREVLSGIWPMVSAAAPAAAAMRSELTATRASSQPAAH